MSILATGAKQVRALELALGGRLTKEAAKRPQEELQRFIKERFALSRAHRAKIDPLLEKARAPLTELLDQDPRTAAAVKALKKDFGAGKRPIPRKPHAPTKLVPRMDASGFSFKAPPYDFAGQGTAANAQASTNVNTGDYSFNISGDETSTGGDGGSAAWAGLAANFLATEDNPSQRFATLLEYSFAWKDWSAPAVAHNLGDTSIWIWGFRENRWVYQNSQYNPSWNDGTGWFEVHGSNGDGSTVIGTEVMEAYFSAFANSWYQAWVWSSGACDDAETSFSYQFQQNSVIYMVFGSL